MLREKLETPQAIEAEFAAAPLKRLSAALSTSQHPQNQARNRKCAIIPYDDTRYVLRSNKRNIDGYINASHVRMHLNAATSLTYVVSQAPIKSTVADYWEMVS